MNGLAELVVYLLLYVAVSSSVSHSEFKDVVISEYKDLCPFTTTCYSNITEDVTLRRYDGFYQELCCGRCRCDAECGLDCCPDQRDVTLVMPGAIDEKIECVRASFIDGEDVLSFKMVASCPPSYEDHETVDGCRKQYTDFRYGEDVADLPPVTSTRTQRLYKNRQCALCHGETDNDLVHWDMSFSCTNTPPYIPGSFGDMLSLVKMTAFPCNILFIKSIPNIEHGQCGHIIDKCNVTGRWEKFDPVTKAACHSYTSFYAKQYKNIHCALCNGHNYNDTKPVCEYRLPETGSSSFVALLDFNQLTTRKTQSKAEEECSPQQIFDPLKEECVAINCSYGFSLSGNRCVPIYKSITSQRAELMYSTALILLPIETNTSVSVNVDDLKESIETDIKYTVDEIGLNSRLCSIYSLVSYKRSIRQQIMEMFLHNRGVITSDIDFIALEIYIGVGYAASPSRTVSIIESILKNYNSSRFHIVHLGDTKSKIKATAMRLYDVSPSRSRLEIDMLNSLPVSRFDVRDIDFGYDIDGKGITSFIRLTSSTAKYGTCITSAIVSYDTFCPKVTIDRKTHDKYFKNNNSDNSTQSFNIHFVKDSLKLDWTNVEICHKRYLEVVKEIHSSEDRDDGNSNESALIILTIVCLSLSILALVITLVVYMFYPNLRTLPGLNNMALVISLILFYIFSLVNACTDITVTWLCRTIGISLHASLLSSFGWMFICTFHMTRVFASISRKPQQSSIRKTFSLYVLFVEGITAAVVVTTVTVSYISSDGSNFGYTDSPCYVAKTTLLFNVAIPVACTIVINFVMFLSVIIIIARLPDVRKNSKNERHNLTIFVKLSSLTGLTWITAFLYQFTGFLAFAYIFVILNASQGIFIMVSFVVNKRVYELIRKTKYVSSSTKTSGLSSNGHISNDDSPNRFSQSPKSVDNKNDIKH